MFSRGSRPEWSAKCFIAVLDTSPLESRGAWAIAGSVHAATNPCLEEVGERPLDAGEKPSPQLGQHFFLSTSFDFQTNNHGRDSQLDFITVKSKPGVYHKYYYYYFLPFHSPLTSTIKIMSARRLRFKNKRDITRLCHVNWWRWSIVMPISWAEHLWKGRPPAVFPTP